MDQSREKSTLSAALVAAQAEMPALTLDGRNDHFGHRYATLGGIISTIRPVLARHGLAVVQSVETRDGALALVTRIAHASGEYIESIFYWPMPLRIHDLGAAITYLRRYALSAMLCLAADHDDDAAPLARPPERSARPERPEPAQQPATSSGVSERVRSAWNKLVAEATELGIEVVQPESETDDAYIAAGRALRRAVDSLRGQP